MEVTYINKQKFLAELGKLLTFMYEEDRQSALAMYTRMFEDAEDEHALIQALISPTRQAVVIARAYNAKERKLQVHSQSREDEGVEEGPDEIPDFILAIMDIYHSAVPDREAENQVPADQLSLFEDDQNPVVEEAAFEEAGEPAVQETSEAQKESDAEAEPAEEAEAPRMSSGEENQPEEPASAPEAEAAQPDDAVDGDAADAEKTQEDKVDEFMANFSLGEEEQVSAPQPKEEPQPEEEGIVLPIAGDEDQGDYDYDDDEYVSYEDGAGEPRVIREPKVFLLILYIILAVPITAVGVLLLLIPTLISLVLAVGVIGTGSMLMIATFSGFSVFADIMVVLGAALVVLALGLLLIWLFIWFIGGAIVGLIRSVIALGGKWCYKEVPAV